MHQEDEVCARSCRRMAIAALLSVSGIGLSVLLGWALDYRPLMTVLPGAVAMKPNTAIAFLLGALSLYLFLLSNSGLRGRLRTASLLLGGLTALLGMLTLVEYASGLSFGIDELFWADYVGGRAGYPPGRMAPISAFNFSLCGIALLLLHFPGRRAMAQALTLVVALTSMLASVGYLFGVDVLYRSGNFTAVALHTAVAFFALCLGLWCATSHDGFMRLLMARGQSGLLLRRYGLVAGLAPFALAWLHLLGERHALYGQGVGAATLAIANTAIFAGLVWFGAASLRRSELKEGRAQEVLRRAHLDLERRVLERTSELAEVNADLGRQISQRARVEQANARIMHYSLDVICTVDAAGRFMQVSRACENLWGYLPEELAGRSYIELVHPDDQPMTLAVATSIMEGVPVTDFENRYLRKDGVAVPIVWTANWSEADQTMFCVARDITPRKQAEDEMRRAKEAAEAATRAKGDFLANMSHEIRTPMSGVIGMTSLLLETNLNPEQQEFAETIRASGESLLSVLNDILDFSKMEAGKLLFEELDFDLRSTVEETLEMLASAAQIKGLELIGIVEPAVPGQLRGDPGRVRQVMMNLLGNAIKFTETGEITLRIVALEESATEVCLRCEIWDTGIGIAPEVQQRLFQAFVQADGSTSRKFGGTGLGLVICQQLAEAMHGTIGVESTPGLGSTFWFTMRLQKQTTPAALAPERALPGMRLLVVDDNAASREMLHQQVVGWGFRNGSAPDGAEALRMLKHAAEAGDAYPLALIDLQMPGMDGLALARAIKQDPRLEATRLILLTPFATTPPAQDLQRAGIAACRQKPVRQSRLFDCIANVMNVGASETEPAPAQAAPGTPARVERILVAEDNPINQRVAVAHLRKLGYCPDVVANGLEALEALESFAYDIIFMDCQMPEMDGYQATAAIRAREWEGGRPWIIAMTAHSMAGDRELCLAAGMDDYLSKPARRAEIEATLARRPMRTKLMDACS